MTPPAGERGSLTPLIPIVLLALFILGGLVVDGSRDLQSRGAAQAYAEEAARAGATAVDLSRSTLTLDETTAAQRVKSYCDAITGGGNGSAHGVEVLSCGLADPGFTDATTCGGVTARIVVNADVTLRIDATLMGIVGFRSFTASGHARARPFEGTNAQNAC